MGDLEGHPVNYCPSACKLVSVQLLWASHMELVSLRQLPHVPKATRVSLEAAQGTLPPSGRFLQSLRVAWGPEKREQEEIVTQEPLQHWVSLDQPFTTLGPSCPPGGGCCRKNSFHSCAPRGKCLNVSGHQFPYLCSESVMEAAAQACAEGYRGTM